MRGKQFKLKAHNGMLVTLSYCMWYSAKKVKNGTNEGKETLNLLQDHIQEKETRLFFYSTFM